jgi:hypothetical protein
MEVILKEDVNKLGHRGDVVKIADGYGRNYLLPAKLAIEATAANKAVIEQMKGSAIRKLAKEKVVAEDLAKQLEAVELVFERKVGENVERHRTPARREGLHGRPAKDLAGRAAEVARRVPCADQAAPRGDQPLEGDDSGRGSAGGHARSRRSRERRVRQNT